MLGSPFNKNSPILHLYERSRSKSQENRQPVKSRSISFRQFQTKLIIKALDKNHVIQKQYNQGRQKDLERQRVRSKLYGPECYQMNSYLPKSYRKQDQMYETKLESEQSKKENEQQLKTMINIRVLTSKRISNPKLMGYESNYAICNKEANYSKADCCSEHISSGKSVSNKSSEKQRKISIVTLEEQLEQQKQKCKSRFIRNKIDHIKQEYSGFGQVSTQLCRIKSTNSNDSYFKVFERI